MCEVTYILGGNIELEVEFNYTPSSPAQLYGPPENCYPAEDEEIEIIAVKCNGKEVDTDDIGIFSSDAYETLDDCITEFISTNREEWADE